MIFPADEVVYLSYGRLIYFPSASQQEQSVEDPPPISHHHHSSIPSTSTTSSKSVLSTVSAPSSFRRSSEDAKLITSNSSSSLNVPLVEKRSGSTPARPKRKKECADKNSRLQVPGIASTFPRRDRKLSYWDYAQISRERTLIVPGIHTVKKLPGSRGQSPKKADCHGSAIVDETSRIVKSELHSDGKSQHSALPVAVTQHSRPGDPVCYFCSTNASNDDTV